MTTLAGRPVVTTGVLHWLSRELEGALVVFPLPLCWDAEARSRFGDVDDELWFLSWDHGALDPTRLVFATAREHVSCRDCLAWLHA